MTDLLNAVFGTQWDLPIPTFGAIVVAAVVIATFVARRETERYERSGKLPYSTSAIVGDLALVAVVAGIVGARIFYLLDRPEQLIDDPVAMIFARAGFSIFGVCASGSQRA